MTTIETVPTLTTVDGAEALLRELAEHHEWVSVFWDRGWGDSGQPVEITIIVGGNGQEPKAHLTREVYRELLDRKVIQPNSYGGYKARKLHDYKTPPEPEKTGPDASDVAEQVVRGVLDALAGEPVVAQLFRGFTPPPRMKGIYESAATPVYDGTWFVLLYPGGAEVAISAQEPTMLGPRIIGDAHCLAYPRTGDDVDLEALAGPAFRAELEAAIRGKLAVIAKTRGTR